MENDLSGYVQQQGRIVYIEPNDLLGNNINYSQNLYDSNVVDKETGSVGDNITVRNEDLTMSVDLQVIMPGRDGLSCDNTSSVLYSLTSDSEKMQSIMQGKTVEVNGYSNNFLTTDYTNATYTELRKNGRGDTESLCIKSITIKYGTNFYPQVDMVLTDVRGYALMMPSEASYREYMAQETGYEYDSTVKGSFFRSLFHLPYPRFVLTVKGYYGKPVTYNLCVSTFKTAFDSKTGDFNVNVSFIGYTYGLFVDLPFNLLLISPYLSMGYSDLKKSSSNQEGFDNHGLFWDEERFVFSDNTKIPTFVEFLRKMASVKQIENNNNSNGAKKINSYQTLRDELTKYKKSIETYMENFVSKKHPSVRMYNASNEMYIYVFTRELKKDFTKAYLNADSYKTFSESFNSFWKKYSMSKEPLSDFAEEKVRLNTTIPSKSDYVDIKDELNINKYPTYDEWSKRNPYETDNVKTEVKKIYSAKQNNRPYFICQPFSGQIDLLDTLIEHINAEIKSMNEEREKELSYITLEHLGFKPTIRNIFRMVFAHINAFTDSFYNLLAYIQEQASERTIEKLGLDIQDTDVVNSDKSDSLAPFPLAYQKNEDGVQEIIYPGNDPRLCNLAEVLYVNDIVKSIFMVKSGIDDALVDSVFNSDKSLSESINKLRSDIESLNNKISNSRYGVSGGYGGGYGGYSDGYTEDNTTNSTPNNNGSRSYSYNVVLPTDLYRKNVNPYNDFKITGDNWKDVWAVAFTRYCLIRMYNTNGSSSITKKMIAADIENFKNSQYSPKIKDNDNQPAKVIDYLKSTCKKIKENRVDRIVTDGYADYSVMNMIPYSFSGGKEISINNTKNFATLKFETYSNTDPKPTTGEMKKTASLFSKYGVLNYLGTLWPSYNCKLSNESKNFYPWYNVLMPIMQMKDFLDKLKKNYPQQYQMNDWAIRGKGLYKTNTNSLFLLKDNNNNIHLCPVAAWCTPEKNGSGGISFKKGNDDAFYKSSYKAWAYGETSTEKNMKKGNERRWAYAGKHILYPYSNPNGGWKKKFNNSKTAAFEFIIKNLGLGKPTDSKSTNRVRILSNSVSGQGGFVTAPLFMLYLVKNTEYINIFEKTQYSTDVLDAFFCDDEFWDILDKKDNETYDKMSYATAIITYDGEKKKYNETQRLGRLLNYASHSKKNYIRINFLFEHYDFFNQGCSLDGPNSMRPEHLSNIVKSFKTEFVDKTFEGLKQGTKGVTDQSNSKISSKDRIVMG